MNWHVLEPEVLAPPGRRLHDVLRAKDGTSRLKREKGQIGSNWMKLNQIKDSIARNRTMKITLPDCSDSSSCQDFIFESQMP